MEQIFFVVSMTIVLLNLINIIGRGFKGATIFPGIFYHKNTTPHDWYIMYPSFFYQVYYWTQGMF